MKSPSSRYLTGYILRAMLGTFLLLCAISAARTYWIGPDAWGEIPPPWDKALILPDRLIHLAIAKISEKHAPQQPTDPLQSMSTSHTPSPQQSTSTTHDPRPMSHTPHVPAMAELPAMPSMPDMPSMPTTAGRDPRTRHAELLAAIKAREKQLQSAGSNPHREEYLKATKTYKQFALKNNALLKEFQDATGDRRMELADELRKLKLDRDRVTKTYESATQRYRTWKEQHPQAKPDLENDPELQRLRQEVANVAQQLATP
jgi:hypothetical protein